MKGIEINGDPLNCISCYELTKKDDSLICRIRGPIEQVGICESGPLTPTLENGPRLGETVRHMESARALLKENGMSLYEDCVRLEPTKIDGKQGNCSECVLFQSNNETSTCQRTGVLVSKINECPTGNMMPLSGYGEPETFDGQDYEEDDSGRIERINKNITYIERHLIKLAERRWRNERDSDAKKLEEKEPAIQVS